MYDVIEPQSTIKNTPKVAMIIGLHLDFHLLQIEHFNIY